MVSPQGSIISPILFSIMINYVFSQVQGDVGCSLFTFIHLADAFVQSNLQLRNTISDTL